jgi:hypothetical protein
MLVKHRSLHLNLIGDAPGIKRLFGDRREVSYKCSLVNKTSDWFKANQARIFAEFGTLSSSAFATNGATALAGVHDDDMRLISNNLVEGKDGPYVDFVYQTLTDSWALEVADETGTTENGLQTMVRNEIAKIGKALTYTKASVGVATIVIGGTTYYLSGLKDNSDDRRARMQTRWAEAGLLKKFVSGGPDELLQISWTFLVAETPGTVVGRVTDRNISNWEGMRTIVISTINAPDGSDILGPDDADKAVMYYQDFRPWTRPGIAGIRTRLRLPPDYSATAVSLFQRSPVQMKLRVHIGAIMSKSPDMTKDTMTAFTGVDRYWNPEKWATLEALPATAGELEGDEPPPPPLAIVDDISRTLRGFRKITSEDSDWNSGTLDENNPTNIKDTGDCKGGNVFLSWVYGQWFGKFLSISTTDGTVLGTASIVAGPERPEGKTWVIDMDNDEAFTDEDGVKYYRKFFVWAYVPELQDGEDVFTDDPNTPIPDVYDDVRGI